MSVCEECDRNLIWGGTSGYLPHTEEFHAQERRRLLAYLKLLLKERMAVKADHKVTIRFTREWSWAECSCSYRDPYSWPDSGQARYSGHVHLWSIGDGIHLGCIVVDTPDGP